MADIGKFFLSGMLQNKINLRIKIKLAKCEESVVVEYSFIFDWIEFLVFHTINTSSIVTKPNIIALISQLKAGT